MVLSFADDVVKHEPIEQEDYREKGANSKELKRRSDTILPDFPLIIIHSYATSLRHAPV